MIEVNDDTVTPMQFRTESRSRGKFYQKVRIHNVNTGKIITAEVPVEKILIENAEGEEENGTVTDAYWAVVEDGDYEIDGVPGSAAYLPLDFSKCAGTLGNVNDGTGGGEVEQLQEETSK